jgi:hypothetical protein
MAVLAVFGLANAQKPAIGITTTAPKVEVTAPKAEVPAVPAATAPTAPKAEVPAAPTAAVPTAPKAEVPAAPAAAVPAAPATPAPAAPVAVPAIVAPPTPIVEAPALVIPSVAAEPTATEPAPAKEAQIAPKADSPIVLIVEEPKKKKRNVRAPKNDFAIVDVPANFEIQARKVMPVTNSEWGDDNLDTWWGRANLMVLTESENFVGKVHLRMYPGQLYGTPTPIGDGKKDRYGVAESRDIFQLYEAWAWHRGDYANIKIGRWDNTSRFGSKTFGGYIDAKKDQNTNEYKGKINDKNEVVQERTSVNLRSSGFMSVYTPENALQFGLNNFSENISLDIALVSGDNHLNKGDLRVYFSFKDLAGLENVDIGLGYRSNVFNEIYNKKGDVTHTIDFGFRMPLAKEAGILKNLNLFVETALIGLNDQIGTLNREDGGGTPHAQGCDPAFPILGGLDFSLYHGLDKIVFEAEYDGNRKASTGSPKDVQGSIYVQKKLNDRFTLNLGVQSENNTKDFSFAGRLQGRIN